MKKEPQRMCLACRCMKPKKDLTRIVKTENDFCVDFLGKQNGRGCYVCKNSLCIENLKKQKCLNRAFKTNVSIETYNKIYEDLVGTIKSN